MDDYKRETTAADALVDNMKSYGVHTLGTQIHHIVDGLKPVHRRILWHIRDVETYQKASEIAGVVMGRYHPAGDSTIANSICVLSQPFTFMRPLTHIESNNGSYADPEPGAPRYVDVRQAEFTKDVYFKGIDIAAFDYIPSETGKGVEPAFLVPKIPMAMINGGFGMPLGFKSEPTIYNFNSVCDMTIGYIEAVRKGLGNNHIHDLIVKHALPDFPTRSVLRNSRAIMDAAKKKVFKHRIIHDGVIDITNHSITIKSVPHGIKASNVYALLGDEIVKKGSFMESNFIKLNGSSVKDLDPIAVPELKFLLTLKRGVNPFDVLEPLIKLIKGSSSWTPIPRLINVDGGALDVTPRMILDIWYTERHRSIVAGLRRKHKKAMQSYRELEAKIIIKGDPEKVSKIYSSAKTEEDTILQLVDGYGLTPYQATLVAKLPLGALTGSGIDKLVTEKERLRELVNSINHQFSKIDDIIIEEVQFTKNKYGKELRRRAIVPNFSHSVMTPGSGVIQCNNMKEAEGYLREFDGMGAYIQIHPKNGNNKVMVKDGNAVTEGKLDFPRIATCSEFTVTRFKPKYTIGLRSDTIFRVNGITYKDDKDLTPIFVSDEFTQITNSGEIERVASTTIGARKTIDSTGVLHDILHISPVVGDDLIVVYGNTKTPNTVRLDRVKPGSRLKKSPLGKTIIVGIYRADEDICFTMPNALLSRCSIKHVYLPVKSNLFGTSTARSLSVSKKKLDDGTALTKYSRNSTLYTVN